MVQASAPVDADPKGQASVPAAADATAQAWAEAAAAVSTAQVLGPAEAAAVTTGQESDACA